MKTQGKESRTYAGGSEFSEKTVLPAKKQEQRLEFQRKFAILVVFMSPIVIPLVAAAEEKTGAGRKGNVTAG